MFESANKETLFNFVDEDFRYARVNLLVSWVGISENAKYVKMLETRVKELFPKR